MTTEVIAWHFAAETLRDGSPLPAAGVELPEIVDLLLSVRGYHGSLLPMDALRYAPGSMVARVRQHGLLIEHDDPPDKYVSSRRCGITDYVDASEALREFSRWCALSVAHCWEMPDVVRRYLETGDESIRNAADDVLWRYLETGDESIRNAAEAAARAAAEAAAGAASGAAAEVVARAASGDAKRVAAWVAAVAEAVAGNAAWDSWDVARDAKAAAMAAQNDRLDIVLTAIVDTRAAS